MNNFEENKNNETESSKKQSIIERFKHMHFEMNDAQANKALKITGLVLISLLCLFVFVQTINGIKEYSTIGEAPLNPYSITVSGHAEVMAKRDVASLSFTSYGEGKTTSEAQTKAAESNNKALEFLKSKGIPEKDISTQGYSTYPKYDQVVKSCPVIRPEVALVPPCNTYDQVISGYETTQTIEFKIRNIDQNPSLSGEIIDGLAATGVRVGNISNSVDNIEEIQSRARNEAIANARIEARKIARSLGVRITRIIGYYDNNYAYPVAEMDFMSARGGDGPAKSIAPQIPGGEGKITADVSVTFEIR